MKLKRKQTVIKYINRAFIALVWLILTAGLVRTVFFPQELNKHENRYAYRIKKPAFSDYLDGSFQKSVSDALNDQIHLSALAKKCYNRATVELAKPLISCLSRQCDDYIRFRGGIFYRDMLLYQPYDVSAAREKLAKRIEHDNAFISAYPDLDFYIYYIEKDTDIDFTTGEKLEAYQQLKEGLALPDGHIAHFAVDSFETFRKYFYRTDHHWNFRGSYLGYKQVISMLSEEAPLTPLRQVDTPYIFSGSKAYSIGADGVYTDAMSVYEFPFTPMTITCDGGNPVEDYGAVDALLAGTLAPVTYGTVYGWDGGEVVFDTNRPERENLLVIGESYDNAIIKLLASHFNKTYGIDLRYYENAFGDVFDFSAYIAQNHVRKVLLIGNIDYFISPEFEIGGNG